MRRWPVGDGRARCAPRLRREFLHVDWSVQARDRSPGAQEGDGKKVISEFGVDVCPRDKSNEIHYISGGKKPRLRTGALPSRCCPEYLYVFSPRRTCILARRYTALNLHGCNPSLPFPLISLRELWRLRAIVNNYETTVCRRRSTRRRLLNIAHSSC